MQLLTFALDHHFRGPSPWHWHFTSLLLHLACIVCLAGVVSVLAGDPLAGLIAAAAYAALGSGPDAVGWVSARGDILCGLFLAVAVWSLAIYLRGGRGLWLLPAAAALLLALGSKEIALVAMAALLPVPWLASGKSRGSRIVAALVILGLAGAFLAWRAATFPSLRPAGDNFVGWQGWRSVRLYLEALWPTLTTILASVQTRALTFNAGPILLGILLVGLARARWRPAAFWLGWRALTAAPAVLFAATGLFRQYVPDLAGAAFLGVALSAGCGMAWRHAGTVPWGISRRPPLKRTPHRWRPNWSRIRLKHRASGAGGG